MSGNSFLQDFCKLEFWVLWSISWKIEFPNFWQVSDHGSCGWLKLSKLRKNFHQHLFVVILGIPIFWGKCKPGKKFNFAEILEKLFPLITQELMKVPWCLIRQKNSRNVWITWLRHMLLRQHVTTLFPEKVGAGTLGHPVVLICRSSSDLECI